MQNSIIIELSKNNAVSGRSLLTSSAKILDESIKHCRYLEYRTFIDFLESVMLHDNVYIIGKFNEREKKASTLMQKLNELNGSDFIHTLDDTTKHFIINDESVDVVFKEILYNIFLDKIQFIRKQLLPDHYIYRYNEDEKTSFLNSISNITKDTSLDEVLTKIRRTIEDLHKQDTNSEFIKHLLRAFEIAAVSKIIKGTAKYTGSRKTIGFLIKNKNKKIHFKTLTYQIYHYANTLFIENQDISKSEFYVPLILMIFLIKLNQKENDKNYLKVIIELRNEFSNFRKNHLINTNLSKKSIDKKNKKLKQTLKYYSEIYRLSSNANFKNLGLKFIKELFIENDNIDLDYEYSYGNDENNSTSESLKLLKIAKNIVNFTIDYYKNRSINKKNKPLTKYFIKALSTQSIIISNKLFEIEEYQKNKMKRFDKFLKTYKI